MIGINTVYIDAIFAFYGYADFFKNPSLLLSWMFEHGCLDTLCLGCLICMRFLFFVICTCSAQLSMFHLERRSRNTIIIITDYTLAITK